MKANQAPEHQPNNPLHNITLERILKSLIDEYGFEELSLLLKVNCFKNNPTLKSSLAFFRKTPWAREKLEKLYLKTDFKFGNPN
jgi:uncharacterized protein (DUF2132 family)